MAFSRTPGKLSTFNFILHSYCAMLDLSSVFSKMGCQHQQWILMEPRYACPAVCKRQSLIVPGCPASWSLFNGSVGHQVQSQRKRTSIFRRRGSSAKYESFGFVKFACQNLLCAKVAYLSSLSSLSSLVHELGRYSFLQCCAPWLRVRNLWISRSPTAPFCMNQFNCCPYRRRSWPMPVPGLRPFASSSDISLNTDWTSIKRLSRWNATRVVFFLQWRWCCRTCQRGFSWQASALCDCACNNQPHSWCES